MTLYFGNRKLYEICHVGICHYDMLVKAKELSMRCMRVVSIISYLVEAENLQTALEENAFSLTESC